MAKSRMTLPPFAALRAFHAAATHERFRDAAENLGVTESAVSHQVRRLEEFLGTTLIDRSGRRSKLTDTGRRYLEQIEPAIQQIRSATEALLPASGRSNVRLTLPPSLAATWLIPRLAGFERQHPEIDLQLVTTTRVVDLTRDQVDLAVRHGKGNWPDVEATFFLDEATMPVCAPDYLNSLPDGPSPEALRDVKFIVNSGIPDEWEEWTRAHGLEPPLPGQLIAMDAMEQALHVAESGHGLAMGRRPIVDDWLASGRLIAPFADSGLTSTAYYLCRPIVPTPTVAGRRVERWLMKMAAEWLKLATE